MVAIVVVQLQLTGMPPKSLNRACRLFFRCLMQMFIDVNQNNSNEVLAPDAPMEARRGPAHGGHDWSDRYLDTSSPDRGPDVMSDHGDVPNPSRESGMDIGVI